MRCVGGWRAAEGGCCGCRHPAKAAAALSPAGPRCRSPSRADASARPACRRPPAPRALPTLPAGVRGGVRPAACGPLLTRRRPAPPPCHPSWQAREVASPRCLRAVADPPSSRSPTLPPVLAGARGGVGPTLCGAVLLEGAGRGGGRAQRVQLAGARPPVLPTLKAVLVPGGDGRRGGRAQRAQPAGGCLCYGSVEMSVCWERMRGGEDVRN